MGFVEEFNNIVNDPAVKRQAERLLHLGADDPAFSSYFGVNYNADKLVSVKLYFCYLKQLPEDDILKEFINDDIYIELIKKHWTPAKEQTYYHQGFTLGLKCYPGDKGIEINKYAYFRTPGYVLGLPQRIELDKEDLEHFPGFCIEHYKGKAEQKQYFYIESEANKQKLLNTFKQQDLVHENDIELIEYTESASETKINMVIKSAYRVKEYLEKNANANIIELSACLYKTNQLYYCAPGVRLDADTKAIYYLPKNMYYDRKISNTLMKLFKM